MAKFFLGVEPSCLKKRVLKPKCVVKNVDWNTLTFELLAKDEQNLLGTNSNYLRSSLGRQEISEHFKARTSKHCNRVYNYCQIKLPSILRQTGKKVLAI